MRVLVVGSGGREHAIAWKLSQSLKCSKIYCAPGNAGIGQIAECVDIKSTNIEGLLKFAIENNIDFTVAGGEDALALGIADQFEEKGMKIYGPKQNAAIIESSKAFSKEFMKKYKIPTAKYEIFNDYNDAVDYLKRQKYPIVVKADGLAVGKGVIICHNINEAVCAVDELMLQKKFGDAGNSLVIEEFLTGTEVTVLAFCDGARVVPMVSAQDYKRAFDNDEGLNTGGMGSRSPGLSYNHQFAEVCMDTIFMPTVDALKKEGREFKGTLYFGLILTDEGPKVIEYNCRFGDPETQAVLPRLKSDLLDIMLCAAEGRLDKATIEWTDKEAVCLILASGGYPEAYEKGYPIHIDESLSGQEDLIVFHSGTEMKGNELVTAGGRVLGITALAENIESARNKVYETVKLIDFDKMHYRKDIGKGF